MEDEIVIDRDAKWNRLECVESVMDYDEFMELVREQVNMYYDSEEAFESNSGSIPGDYKDDYRTSVLVKYIHHELIPLYILVNFQSFLYMLLKMLMQFQELFSSFY